MALSTWEDVSPEILAEGGRLEQEMGGLIAESGPKPEPDGLREGMRQNVILQAKLAGTILTEPMGNVAELSYANKENRSTARSQLSAASSEAASLQRHVLALCQSVDLKFSEMQQKMNEMSQRVERLQAQKDMLEKMEQEKMARATFRLGDEEHKSSTVHQQLAQVEKKLDLVRRTQKACESAVQDLVAWQDELTAKNKHIEDQIGERERQQQASQAAMRESQKTVGKLKRSQRAIEELSGVTLVHRDQSQVVVQLTPLVHEADNSAVQSRGNTVEPIEMAIHLSTSEDHGGERIDSVELVTLSGRSIPIKEDISWLLAQGDLPMIINWVQQHLGNAMFSKPS